MVVVYFANAINYYIRRIASIRKCLCVDFIYLIIYYLQHYSLEEKLLQKQYCTGNIEYYRFYTAIPLCGISWNWKSLIWGVINDKTA